MSPNGIEQVSNACAELAARDINPSVVKYSLAAKSIDTANLIASKLMVSDIILLSRLKKCTEIYEISNPHHS